MDTELVTSSDKWLRLSLKRTSKGMDIWVQVDPRVEEFVASLGDGTYDPLEAYARGWLSGDPLQPIMVTKLIMDIEERGGYSIQSPGGVLYSTGYSPNGKIQEKGSTNLAFLRFRGVGSPEGVKFFVAGAHPKEYFRKVAERILLSSKELIKDYITPVHIDLIISSKEL